MHYVFKVVVNSVSSISPTSHIEFCISIDALFAIPITHVVPGLHSVEPTHNIHPPPTSTQNIFVVSVQFTIIYAVQPHGRIAVSSIVPAITDVIIKYGFSINLVVIVAMPSPIVISLSSYSQLDIYHCH